MALEEKLKTAEEKLGAAEENLQVKKITISSYFSFSFPSLSFLNALNFIETDAIYKFLSCRGNLLVMQH